MEPEPQPQLSPQPPSVENPQPQIPTDSKTDTNTNSTSTDDAVLPPPDSNTINNENNNSNNEPINNPSSTSADDAVLPPPNNNNNNNNPSDDTNGDREPERNFSAEEVKAVLEVIASTGRFWHEWSELKRMLIFQLKQVLSQYPEAAAKSDDQQNSAPGETFQGLANRLEEVILSFIDGPPFTLQRVCEILLNARAIYPNLSKLALALEKNLLVTSTLTKSVDPYPSTVPQSNDLQVLLEDAHPEPHSNAVENGVVPMMGDKDVVMSEADAPVDDGVTMDMEAIEELIDSSGTLIVDESIV